jgi:D-amino-acid dehydrogenase
MAEAGEKIGLVKNGLMMLCKTENKWREEVETAEQAGSLGLRVRVLDASEAASLEPGIEMDIYGAVHYEDDCHLDPSRYVSSREQAFIRAGGRFLYGQRVTGWRHYNGVIKAVATAEGEIAGDFFVLAGGAWSSERGTVSPIQVRFRPQRPVPY